MLDAVFELFDLVDLFQWFRRHVSSRARKRQSVSWPAAKATVVSGRVQELAGRYRVSAPYWFYADGERYGGRYEREFIGESQARDALRRMLASSLMVRYKPRDPNTSILDDD